MNKNRLSFPNVALPPALMHFGISATLALAGAHLVIAQANCPRPASPITLDVINSVKTNADNLYNQCCQGDPNCVCHSEAVKQAYVHSACTIQEFMRRPGFLHLQPAEHRHSYTFYLYVLATQWENAGEFHSAYSRFLSCSRAVSRQPSDEDLNARCIQQVALLKCAVDPENPACNTTGETRTIALTQKTITTTEDSSGYQADSALDADVLAPPSATVQLPTRARIAAIQESAGPAGLQKLRQAIQRDPVNLTPAGKH